MARSILVQVGFAPSWVGLESRQASVASIRGRIAYFCTDRATWETKVHFTESSIVLQTFLSVKWVDTFFRFDDDYSAEIKRADSSPLNRRTRRSIAYRKPQNIVVIPGYPRTIAC